MLKNKLLSYHVKTVSSRFRISDFPLYVKRVHDSAVLHIFWHMYCGITENMFGLLYWSDFMKFGAIEDADRKLLRLQKGINNIIIFT